MGHLQNSTLLRFPNFSCKIETAPLLIFADKLRRVFNFSLLNLEVSLRMGVFQMSLYFVSMFFVRPEEAVFYVGIIHRGVFFMGKVYPLVRLWFII